MNRIKGANQPGSWFLRMFGLTGVLLAILISFPAQLAQAFPGNDFSGSRPGDNVLAGLRPIEGLFSQSFQAEATSACPSPVRIMPLGDSITRGLGSSTRSGYRRPLYFSLSRTGYSFDFVGSQMTGVRDFDRNHEGYSGWHAEDPFYSSIAPNVYNWLVANPADVVLLHIGTNDISKGTQSAAEVGHILDEIDRYDPETTVILALIINRKTYSDVTTQYNADLQAMAQARIAAGDKIVVVDMENALIYPGDMYDNVHPNDNGYARMSAVWSAALEDYLAACSTPPTVTPTGIVSPSPTPISTVLPSATPTATVLPTATPVPPSGCGGVLQEAETGVLSGSFTVGNDSLASGGKYIHVPDGSGNGYGISGNSHQASFCFNVTDGGTYRLKGWVYASATSSDSFFVQVNGSPSAGYTWNLLRNTNYSVDYLNDRSLADPVEIGLAAGQHNVTIFLREDGARLDKLELERVSSSPTNTPGPAPSPTPTPLPPTATSTQLPAGSPTPTLTRTSTSTQSPAASFTPTSTNTFAPSATFTPTSSPAATGTLVPTATSTPVSGGSIVWPVPEWTTASPAEVGMDGAKLNQARDYALQGGGSGYITRHGKLVLSWGSSTQRYDLKSTTKSIGSIALGLAIQDDGIDLEQTCQPFLSSFGIPPDSNTGTGWLDDVTFRQLAMHTAGFDKPGGYNALLFAPGSMWSYSDGGVNWLADCLTVIHGQDLHMVLFNRAFTPMGIPGIELVWRNNAFREDTINGIKRREFASGIKASVDALARIGYLFLRGGQWDGQQLIPKSFVDVVGKPATSVVGLPERLPAESFNASDHIGLLWWTNADGTLANVPRDAYWAWGLGDSLIVVIPSLDIVASRAGSGWQTGWVPDYEVVRGFIEPLAQSVQPPP